MDNNFYDIIIIGEGIAGMTAAIYAKRAGANVLILEKNAVGGQAAWTYEIANFPGFKNISGFEFVNIIKEQCKALGIETKYQDVTKIENDKIKKVHTNKDIFECKSIILCLGASPNTLNVEGEEKFKGRGVSYCAICDGAFYRNKNVAIVGSGNTAAEDAGYLANIANKVYILNRKDHMKAQDILLDRLTDFEKNGKIQYLYHTEVSEILGENKISTLKLYNNLEKSYSNLDIDGLFIAIGRRADTSIVKDLVKLDEYNYILVDDHKMTSEEGIFAAGDCTNTVLRQLVTSASDGAIAGTFAYEYTRK